MNRLLNHATRTFKSTRAILAHARADIADRDNWTQSTLQVCTLPERNPITGMPFKKEFSAEFTPIDAAKANAQCKCCALGAALYYTSDSVLDATASKLMASGTFANQEEVDDYGVAYNTPAAELLDKAAKELYGLKFGVVDINDGHRHKTISGAHKATLRVFDRAIEMAS